MSYHPLTVEFRGKIVEIDYHNVCPSILPRWFDGIELEWDFNEIGMEKANLNLTESEEKMIVEAIIDNQQDQAAMRN